MAEGSSCNYSPNRKEKTDQMDAAARSKKDKEVVEIVKEQLEACRNVISDILNRVVKNEEKETQQLRLAAQRRLGRVHIDRTRSDQLGTSEWTRMRSLPTRQGVLYY
ncbi:hypothetical protein J6590_074187 [Homalodisca vitripennis]|nr:hypothetical protein J6590_074187 [Homalodisca vitripennis]